MTPFEKRILRHVTTDYAWSDVGIVRLGKNGDVAAFACGDFSDWGLVFCHGNGETAVSERYWFEQFASQGVSVVCPDYRGYGLSAGPLSETGCYDVAHVAYDWLVNEKNVLPSRIVVLGYSLGSAIAVELAASVPVAALVLQAPFLSGSALRAVWDPHYDVVCAQERETSFPTDVRLASIRVPALVLHGTDDGVIPFVQGRAVFDALASRRKRFLPIAGSGHCDFQRRLGDKYVSAIVAFLRTSGRQRSFLRRLGDVFRTVKESRWRVG